MDKNKVKIDLYKSKAVAYFSGYVSGNLYYNVEVGDEGEIYQFPIPTVEEATKSHTFNVITGPINIDIQETVLSTDLGTTTFYAEMKGSELIRWIGKAIDNGEFTKVK